MEETNIAYKVGDKVKLRGYLKTGLYYGGQKFEEFCRQDFGKVLTITKVTPCNGYISTTKYEFEETPLEYTVEMLEPIKEKTMKYKAGDKVKIRKDLKAGARYGSKELATGMLKYCGKEAVITKVLNDFYTVTIDDERWSWTDEMLEPIVNCDFKIGDKVIFKDTEGICTELSVGVFTVKNIATTCEYIQLEEERAHNTWFRGDRFIKVPLFKIGQIVQFHNIEEDKWYSGTNEMANIEGKCGIITKVTENRYVADKQGQDGCSYEVKDFRDGGEWCVTSASLELVPMGKTSCITSVKQDEPELIADIADIADTRHITERPITAEMLAQAVDNVKGPQFKIGDRVLIREDLIPGKIYEEWDYSPEDGMGGWEFAAVMAKYMGKVATITGYVGCDPNYCYLDIDKGTYSWIVNALLPYIPGSDYDLDKTIITNKQTKQNNYENRLQEKGPVIAGRERQSGCAVRYPGEQIRVGISNLGYRKVTCKRQEGS